MSLSVRIRGDGVAARCCAHLLRQAGHRVRCEPSSRARVPVIMLSEAAQQLMRDIFGRPDLFRDLPQIRKRVVAWGPDAPVAELDHSAAIISEEALLDRLGLESDDAVSDAHWTIYAARPLPGEAVEHRFGTRMAWPVAVRRKSSREACWIESLEQGWLFLLSDWLIAVGAPPDELLARSRLVKEQIGDFEPATAQFPASPRIVTPLGGNSFICCGTAALAFDPLCGDGTAHAVREAILASAVIRSSQDSRPLLAHYEARLTAGMERHLAQCLPFYLSGGSGPWWKEQVQSVEQGLEWCRSALDRHGRFQYRLNGFELDALG